MKSICAVCHDAFEIGDNDKVFISVGDTTRTVCVPCQNKIRKMEVCDICGEPRPNKSVKTIRLVGYGTFQRICVWCIKRIHKRSN